MIIKTVPGGTGVSIMETRTETLTTKQVGIIQANCQNYNCEVVAVGLLGKGKAMITVEGLPEDLDELFKLVLEPNNKENE